MQENESVCVWCTSSHIQVVLWPAPEAKKGYEKQPRCNHCTLQALQNGLFGLSNFGLKRLINDMAARHLKPTIMPHGATVHAGSQALEDQACHAHPGS